MVHSGAARAAVENMMRTLSVEWARFGIRLCALAAGQFDTETLRTKYPKAVVEGVPRTVPLQRLGTEEEMGLAGRLPGLPGGRLLLGQRGDDGRRPRQLVRALAAAAVAAEAGEPPARGAPAQERRLTQSRGDERRLGGAQSREPAQVVMPPNWPPVTFSTCPWT